MNTKIFSYKTSEDFKHLLRNALSLYKYNKIEINERSDLINYALIRVIESDHKGFLKHFQDVPEIIEYEKLKKIRIPEKLYISNKLITSGLTYESILGIVEKYFGFDIKKLDRQRRKCYARYLFYKLCKKYIIGSTTSKVGKVVNRDHSSVTHGKQQFVDILSQDADFEKDYFNLLNLCDIERNKTIDLLEKTKSIFGKIKSPNPLRKNEQQKSLCKVLDQRRSTSKVRN